jgi:hypothetical protein
MALGGKAPLVLPQRVEVTESLIRPCAPHFTKLSDLLLRCREGLIAVGAFSMVMNLLVLTV